MTAIEAPRPSSSPLATRKKTPGYELRYVGDFGFSLHSKHAEYEDALRAKRTAYDVATRAGDKRLAASFEIV